MAAGYLAAVERRDFGRGKAIATLCAMVALLLCGCGGGGGGSSAKGSTASFDVNGYKISITAGNGASTSIKFSRSPQLDFSGPEGCKGQAFTFSGVGNGDNLFRYSSSDAYMVFDGTVYHFVMGPQSSSGALVWDQTFGRDHVTATVDCPPPPQSGPLLPPNY